MATSLDGKKEKEKKRSHHNHHQHHNNNNNNTTHQYTRGLSVNGVCPPKKSARKEKKRRGSPSTTKLNFVGSSHNLRKEPSYDTLFPLVPAIAASDTNLNVFNEQGSSQPTKMTTMARTAGFDAMAQSPAAAATPPPPPVKWKGEDVSRGYLEKLDAPMARLEYVEVCGSTQIDIEKDCQIWKKNFAKNQSEAYPVPDATLVKITGAPDDYVNMSMVTVPHCRYPIMMGQIPKKGCEEDFWKVVYQESTVMMYVLIGADDEKACEFFPTTEGAYCNYGNMFINIRKLEKMDEERTRYTIEVLPNGFSNSVLVNAYVHTGWEPHGVPVKYANTTRSVVDVMNFVKQSSGAEKLLIVSRNGCGRAGFFLALGASFCCLNDNSEPRIVEIVRAIRTQRPNAVDSLKQYASLYLAVIYYIKKKITVPEGMKAKVEKVTEGLQALIKEDLSIVN